MTPIGGNRFTFWRVSKQFTPAVIREVGRENVLVVGTGDKVSKLDRFWMAAGDLALDETLSGYIEVTVSYREAMVMKVRC
ncbi:MAG: hypothetical protein J7M39_16160 [Anaerolineae bacterium]|nr:hypothetical protein [Anaerolineae bacterium]